MIIDNKRSLGTLTASGALANTADGVDFVKYGYGDGEEFVAVFSLSNVSGVSGKVQFKVYRGGATFDTANDSVIGTVQVQGTALGKEIKQLMVPITFVNDGDPNTVVYAAIDTSAGGTVEAEVNLVPRELAYQDSIGNYFAQTV